MTYNPLKGSLTKTVHIGTPSRASSSQGSLAPVPTVTSQPTSAQTVPSAPFSKTPVMPPAVTDKEKYIEVCLVSLHSFLRGLFMLLICV